MLEGAAAMLPSPVRRRPEPALPRRSLVFSLLALFITALPACEAPKPERLEMRPNGPFDFSSAGASREVKITGFDAKNRPFTAPLNPTFKSSAPGVADVDDKGKITSKSSGTATITATALGKEVTAEVTVSIAKTIEIAEDTPKELTLKSKPFKVAYVIKDDKGQPIEGKKPTFQASDYCVEVSTDGEVKPLSLGKCEVILNFGKAEASHTIEVK
jgi:hypothetical protein